MADKKQMKSPDFLGFMTAAPAQERRDSESSRSYRQKQLDVREELRESATNFAPRTGRPPKDSPHWSNTLDVTITVTFYKGHRKRIDEIAYEHRLPSRKVCLYKLLEIALREYDKDPSILSKVPDFPTE